MPLLREHGFAPDLGAIEPDVREKARLMYFNYPNNPTGSRARRPVQGGGRVRADRRRGSSCTTRRTRRRRSTATSPRASSRRTRAKDVGVEVFSLSKGYNMTGWRTAAIVENAAAIEEYWRLKTNIDSGVFDAVQLAAAATLEQGDDFARDMSAVYQRRPRPGVRRPARDRRGRDPAEGDDLHLGAGARGYDSASYAEHVLESGVVVSPGGAYGPNGEGFFRISLTVADERLTEAVGASDRASRASDALLRHRAGPGCCTTCASCASCAPRTAGEARGASTSRAAPAPWWRGSARSA